MIFLSLCHVNKGNHQIFNSQKITPLFKSYEKIILQYFACCNIFWIFWQEKQGVISFLALRGLDDGSHFPKILFILSNESLV